MQETLNLPFRFALESPTGALYVNLQRLGIGGGAETYLVLTTSGEQLKPIQGDDFTAPVELAPLGPVPGELGEPIRHLIERMLTLEPDHRPPAADLLSDWRELFLEAARRAHALNGQVL